MNQKFNKDQYKLVFFQFHARMIHIHTSITQKKVGADYGS